MYSFCLDHGLFGFIFLSVSSACSLFVSSSYPSHPRDPSSFHLVSETKRIKTIRRAHLSMSRRIFYCGGIGISVLSLCLKAVRSYASSVCPEGLATNR